MRTRICEWKLARKRPLLAAWMLTGVLFGDSAAAVQTAGWVVGNGGFSAPPGSSGALGLYGTVGQAAVGKGASTRFGSCHGFWCFGGSRVVAVDPTLPTLPEELSFGPPTPNPARGETRFILGLPREADVTLSVFDVAGRKVGQSVTEHLGPGYHQLHWQAPSGRSGVYFARLMVDREVRAERRIIVIH